VLQRVEAEASMAFGFYTEVTESSGITEERSTSLRARERWEKRQ
jgi:hypothetical protein